MLHHVFFEMWVLEDLVLDLGEEEEEEESHVYGVLLQQADAMRQDNVELHGLLRFVVLLGLVVTLVVHYQRAVFGVDVVWVGVAVDVNC